MASCHYLAIDPGNSTGWAAFTEDGKGITMGTEVSRKGVYTLLDEWRPKFIIMEDWITRQGVNLGGDRLEVVRVIGAIEHWAHTQGAEVYLQPNTIKPIGYKWAGMVKPKNHAHSHETDAYVHGVYYLQKAGIRMPQQGKGAND